VGMAFGTVVMGQKLDGSLGWAFLIKESREL
jgi:hypothetical protein